MPEPEEYVDPTDIGGVNERLRVWASSCEAIHPVAIRHVVIAEDAVDVFIDLVRSESRGGRVTLVVDRTPMRRDGDDLKALLEDLLAEAVPLTVRRYPEENPAARRGDMDGARRLAEELRSCTAVVAVGSGSITDVVKYARHLATADEGHAERGARAAMISQEPSRRVLPMISFPTAASVTAYTSDLAVLTVDGVKRTLPVQAPDVVVCDLKVLADAPPEMTRAGFGDVLARSVAYGDWYLANELGMDDGFSLVPGRLLAAAESAMIDCADQVASGGVIGLRRVVEALLLSGMAMSVVKQTAPISGWEHVISHFLDLTARVDGRTPALHGAQVGVATLVAARAYEKAWPDLDLDQVLKEVDVAAVRRVIEGEFLRLDDTGRLAAEVWRDLQKKLTRWNDAHDARKRFVLRKDSGELDAFLTAHVRPSGEITDALVRSTAPRRFCDLNEPIAAERSHAAVMRAHTIRSRFTLGDLLSHAGWLDDERAATLLDESDRR